MTPQIIHRYTFPIADVIKTLVGETIADRTWSIRFEGREIVIDAVAPDVTVTKVEIDECRPSAASAAAQLASERKGGPMAQRAGIACNEKGFWTFLALRYDADVSSAHDAANWIREHCGIASRVDLDHESKAAALFNEVDRRYRLWLEGYDD